MKLTLLPETNNWEALVEYAWNPPMITSSAWTERSSHTSTSLVHSSVWSTEFHIQTCRSWAHVKNRSLKGCVPRPQSSSVWPYQIQVYMYLNYYTKFRKIHTWETKETYSPNAWGKELTCTSTRKPSLNVPRKIKFRDVPMRTWSALPSATALIVPYWSGT